MRRVARRLSLRSARTLTLTVGLLIAMVATVFPLATPEAAATMQAAGWANAPQERLAPAVEFTRVALRWSPPAGLDADDVHHFRLSYRLRGSGDRWTVQNLRGSRTGYWFTGLEPGTEYTFAIRAFGHDGEISALRSQHLTTLDDSDRPTRPPTASAISVDRTTAEISWRASRDASSGVETYAVRQDKKIVKRVSEPDADGIFRYRFNNLEPGTTYSFAVNAVDYAGNNSNWRRWDDTTTVADNPPSAPSRPTKTWAALETSVDVHWGDATDDVSVVRYEILVDGALYATRNGTHNRITVRNLNPGTAYEIAIHAVDRESQQGPALRYNVVTAVPLVPEPVATPTPVTAVGSLTNLRAEIRGTQTYVTWDAFAGASSYSVTWGNVVGQPTLASYEANTTSQQTFTVVALNASGHAISQPTSATSVPIVPKPVATPTSVAAIGSLANLRAEIRGTQTYVTWDAFAGASSYSVTWGNVVGQPTLASYEANTTSQQTFTVVALNASGHAISQPTSATSVLVVQPTATVTATTSGGGPSTGSSTTSTPPPVVAPPNTTTVDATTASTQPPATPSVPTTSPETLGACSNLQAERTGVNGIYLTWSAAANADSYAVQVTGEGRSDWYTAYETELLLTGYVPGTYEIRVFPKSSQGFWSLDANWCSTSITLVNIHAGGPHTGNTNGPTPEAESDPNECRNPGDDLSGYLEPAYHILQKSVRAGTDTYGGVRLFTFEKCDRTAEVMLAAYFAMCEQAAADAGSEPEVGTHTHAWVVWARRVLLGEIACQALRPAYGVIRASDRDDAIALLDVCIIAPDCESLSDEFFLSLTGGVSGGMAAVAAGR